MVASPSMTDPTQTEVADALRVLLDSVAQRPPHVLRGLTREEAAAMLTGITRTLAEQFAPFLPEDLAFMLVLVQADPTCADEPVMARGTNMHPRVAAECLRQLSNTAYREAQDAGEEPDAKLYEEIPATLSIRTYAHCRACMESLPRKMSPKDWARLAFGFTEKGIQVWCTRHATNVTHIHFEGQQHPSNDAPTDRRLG